ncbi:cation diffusion facilitator family transporter [Corallococcus carmarthensis]|uniref:Cation diffusion facilitator family transporter n=1 Tax=Corallococcus carmarthensis TaxID=2316728 RepID=A0A3A8JXL0_9BACT|nr:cation diffusion facilitator family transporter [Corallococcus carmarthensis]RKG95111.1 cation diffusion facilitator family transporter [Corallococcus carmarthensis]
MSAPASSLKAVIAALSGNVLVTLIKFIAFSLSGSGAMLSEAIHSAADTGNQVLLFLGLKRAARVEDDSHPYGYGGERFIFGILSASGIFFVGCGVTLYHGIQSLLHPHVAETGPVTFAVLGASFLIEGGVLTFAVAGLLKQAAGEPFFRFVRQKADPASVAILLEDGAAVLGLVLATAGIGLAHVTGNPLWDAAASLTVGVLLGLIALYLMVENRELLLGRSVPADVEQRFEDLLRARPSLADLHDVKTRRLTPEVYQFKAELRFSEAFVAARLEEALPSQGLPPKGAERERALTDAARHLIRTMSEEIDAIEAEIRRAIPQAKHIDLELEHLTAAAAEAAEELRVRTG